MTYPITENNKSKNELKNELKKELPSRSFVAPEPQYLRYKNYRAISIEDRHPQEVYEFFRNFDNLQRYMKGIEEIKVVSFHQSHWKIRLKTGLSLEWDVEIVEEIPGVMLRWQSLPQSHVNSQGVVLFTKALSSTGTVVSVSMDCDLPGGKMTGLAAMLTGDDPNSLIQNNLRRLKAYMETGEIPTTQGQSSGREDTSITEH